MNIFAKNKVYCFQEIVNICDSNGLITVDCLKEENMISIEKFNNGELGDCIFEFRQIQNDLFRLIWVDKINL
jgi:hypothetical protein